MPQDRKQLRNESQSRRPRLPFVAVGAASVNGKMNGRESLRHVARPMPMGCRCSETNQHVDSRFPERSPARLLFDLIQGMIASWLPRRIDGDSNRSFGCALQDVLLAGITHFGRSNRSTQHVGSMRRSLTCTCFGRTWRRLPVRSTCSLRGSFPASTNLVAATAATPTTTKQAQPLTVAGLLRQYMAGYVIATSPEGETAGAEHTGEVIAVPHRRAGRPPISLRYMQ